MKGFKKGFTLIELLVVIAIIGILASVVLASLNSARQKGQSASVKANLKGIQSGAALYYDTNASYGTAAVAPAVGSCTPGTNTLFADATIQRSVAQVATQAVASACGVSVGSNGAYVMSVQLNEGGVFCVDSTGQAKTYATGTAISTITGTACN